MSDNRKGFFRRKSEAPEVRTAVVPGYTGPLPGVLPPNWGDTGTQFVTVDQCLSIPAVYRSVTIISTAVSQLGMKVKRQGNEVASALAAQPDSNRSQSSFFKRTVHDLATTGNAYWRLYRNSDGAVVSMQVLSPSNTSPKYDEAGTKVYDYTDASGKTYTLTNNVPNDNSGQVEHIKLGEFDGHIKGRGPIQCNNAALYSILDQRFYYERFLRESKRPSGIYAFKGNLDSDELAQAKARIQANRTTGEPDVLNGDVTYTSVMFTPEEAALVDLQKQAVLEVARMFGVPAYKLASGVEGNSMTYQNIAQADQAWIRESLEQYLTAIEDSMTSVLPRGQVAQFDTDNWLRAAEALATPIQPKESAPAA